MTEEQIEQNAEEYSKKNYGIPFEDNSSMNVEISEESYIAGAHSRDEEVKRLYNSLEHFRSIINNLRNPWISVEDEKPAEEKDVIFMLPDGLVYRGFRKVIGIRDRVFLRGVPKGTNCYMISDVSHWMTISELKNGE